MERNKILYDIKDISDILQISIPTAYKVVKCLNDELSKKKNKYGDNYTLLEQKYILSIL